MRTKLDDNERGAFQFLALGVLLVLAVRGLAWAFSRLGPELPPDLAALASFQQDYPLLRGRLAVVSTGVGLSERLMQAVVLAVGLALVVAVVQAVPAWRQRRPPKRGAARITRLVLYGILAWGTAAALFLPLQEAAAVGGRLEISERKAAFGQIPWPWPAQKRTLPAAGLEHIEARAMPSRNGCDGETTLWAMERSDSLLIARCKGQCPEAELEGLGQASSAAAILERELSTGR